MIKNDLVMVKVLIWGMLLVGIFVSCADGVVRRTPDPKEIPLTSEQATQKFVIAMYELEMERDSVVADFQYLSANMMDMATLEVFDETESLATRQQSLYSRLLFLEIPNTRVGAVHTAFAVAYRTELEAYKMLNSTTQAGDFEGMTTSLSGFLGRMNFIDWPMSNYGKSRSNESA